MPSTKPVRFHILAQEVMNLFPYFVQPGDTLYRIAARFNVPVAAILTANPGLDPYSLYVGQRILIPAPVPTPYPVPYPLPYPLPYPIPYPPRPYPYRPPHPGPGPRPPHGGGPPGGRPPGGGPPHRPPR